MNGRARGGGQMNSSPITAMQRHHGQDPQAKRDAAGFIFGADERELRSNHTPIYSGRRVLDLEAQDVLRKRNTANEEPREQAGETLDQTDQRKKRNKTRADHRAHAACVIFTLQSTRPYLPADNSCARTRRLLPYITKQQACMDTYEKIHTSA